MKLKVLLPSRVLLDRDVDKIVAEAANGSFGLLENHVDFVAALAPGVLAYVDSEDGRERFLGLDEGILIKRAGHVQVSVRDAVQAEALGELRQAVEERFLALDERRRMVRSSVARLEAGFARKYMEFQKNV